MSYQILSVTDQWDTLFTTTLRKFVGAKFEDNVFRNLPFLFWLKQGDRKKLLDGGYEIIERLMYRENSGAHVYSAYGTLNVAPTEGLTAAKFPWIQFSIPVAISSKEMLQNSGDSAKIDLLEFKEMQAEESLRWLLADLLFGLHGSGYDGTGGKTYGDSGNTVDSNGGSSFHSGDPTALAGFNSLDQFVRFRGGYIDTASATARAHTCGGLTTSFTSDGAGASYALTANTNPWWINYSIPGLTRIKRLGIPGSPTSTDENDLALDVTGPIGASGQNLVGAMRALYNRLDETPDLGLCGEELYGVYEGAAVQFERLTNTKVADLGFENLKYKGMTLMKDHGLTTTLKASGNGTAAPLYMLNSKYFKLAVHKDRDFFVSPFLRPYDQDAKVAQILWMGNLICSNRQKQGVLECFAVS